MSKYILINLVPIQAGGGLQNALSFLSGISKDSKFCDKCLIVVRKRSSLHKYATELKLDVITIEQSAISRIKFELFSCRQLINKYKISIVFSLFGGSPYFSSGAYKISGFAYSNIIQSEVPFWDYLPLRQQLLKKLIDKIRLASAVRCDELILETHYLKKRAIDTVFRNKVVHVVEMAPSNLVMTELLNTPVSEDECMNGILPKKILYLSSPHPNKRIHLLAPVFSKLSEGDNKFELVTTLPEHHKYTRAVEQEFKRHNVSGNLKNFGPVDPINVAKLLQSVDAVINVALLESFSNNWVEAWAAKKLLITTDAEWARKSCHDSAVFIDPTQPENSARKIAAIFSSPEDLSLIVKSGEERIRQLPTSSNKTDAYKAIITKSLDKFKNEK